MITLYYVIAGLVILVFLAIFILSVYALVRELQIRSVMETEIATFERVKPKKGYSIFIACECRNSQDEVIAFETTSKKIKEYKQGDTLVVFSYKKKHYWAADTRLIPLLITIVSGILSMVCIVESIGLLIAMIEHFA